MLITSIWSFDMEIHIWISDNKSHHTNLCIESTIQNTCWHVGSWSWWIPRFIGPLIFIIFFLPIEHDLCDSSSDRFANYSPQRGYWWPTRPCVFVATAAWIVNVHFLSSCLFPVCVNICWTGGDKTDLDGPCLCSEWDIGHSAWH